MTRLAKQADDRRLEAGPKVASSRVGKSGRRLKRAIAVAETWRWAANLAGMPS